MPPNVVVFFTDQQRWDTCGYLGCPLELTPNLDYWAQRGTIFPYATTPQPVCGPARACLQTGCYATAIGDGCHTNGRPLPQDHDTLAKRFREAGYATGYFGKWHLAPTSDDSGWVPHAWRAGWDTFLGSNTPELDSDGYDAKVYHDDGPEMRLPGYRVDAITDLAIRWIDQQIQQDQPFISMVSHLEPHMQNHRDAHPAPAGYEERYRGRWTPPDLLALPGADPFYANHLGGNAQQALPGYLGSIKRIDEAFGRLMDVLISRGQLENTVVVFTADHGCHFRTRNHEYKRSCHDVSVRVPCVFHGGPFLGGQRDDRPFQLTDLAPTLCDAAGLKPPQGAQGRSALGVLPDEAYVQISESTTCRAVRTTRWKYAATSPDSAPSDRYGNRYIESHLYDLVADPYELVNLAGLPSHAEVRQDLKQRLLRRLNETGEPVVDVSDAPSPDPAPGQMGQRELRPSDGRHPLTS